MLRSHPGFHPEVTLMSFLLPTFLLQAWLVRQLDHQESGCPKWANGKPRCYSGQVSHYNVRSPTLGSLFPTSARQDSEGERGTMWHHTATTSSLPAEKFTTDYSTGGARTRSNGICLACRLPTCHLQFKKQLVGAVKIFLSLPFLFCYMQLLGG